MQGHVLNLVECCVLWAASEESSEEQNDQFGYAQLDKLDAVIHKKRPELMNREGVVFYHDKSHTSLQIREKLLKLGWDLIASSIFTSDLNPSDYLFRSFQNSLNEKRFFSEEILKWYLKQFFAEKDKKFFKELWRCSKDGKR